MKQSFLYPHQYPPPETLWIPVKVVSSFFSYRIIGKKRIKAEFILNCILPVCSRTNCLFILTVPTLPLFLLYNTVSSTYTHWFFPIQRSMLIEDGQTNRQNVLLKKGGDSSTRQEKKKKDLKKMTKMKRFRVHQRKKK